MLDNIVPFQNLDYIDEIPQKASELFKDFQRQIDAVLAGSDTKYKLQMRCYYSRSAGDLRIQRDVHNGHVVSRDISHRIRRELTDFTRSLYQIPVLYHPISDARVEFSYIFRDNQAYSRMDIGVYGFDVFTQSNSSVTGINTQESFKSLLEQSKHLSVSPDVKMWNIFIPSKSQKPFCIPGKTLKDSLEVLRIFSRFGNSGVSHVMACPLQDSQLYNDTVESIISRRKRMLGA